MSKKSKKKDLKRLKKIVRIQSRLTRNMIRNGIGSVMDDLNNIGNVSVDTRNLLLKFMEEFESSSLPLSVESINLKSKKGKTKNKKYNKKKIKKYVRKQVKKEYNKIYHLINEYNKIYHLLNDSFDDSSDDTNHQINGIVDLVKINGIEGMESFCKDVLNIPPEFILGPDYKKHMNDSSKNDCEESDKTESDKTEDDNKDDVTSKEFETDKKEDLETDKKDEEFIKEEVTPMKHECIDDSRELY